MTTTTKAAIRAVIYLTPIILTLIIIVYGLNNLHEHKESVKAFDHSECQYPNRITNPANGCDNSDWSDPTCIKYGYEPCDGKE